MYPRKKGQKSHKSDRKPKQPELVPFYYIHTEIYALKSHVLNFCTEISSGQSEERTTFFTCKRHRASNQKPRTMFFTAANFPPPVSVLGGRCLNPFIQREDLFQGKLLLVQREFFSVPKVK